MLLTDILTTQENKTGGILIVLAPDFVQTGEAVLRSFFPDRMLGLGKVLDDFASWFELWGIPLARKAGSETSFERSFCVATWPDTMPEHAHGPQLVPKIAENAFALNALLLERRPRLVIFLSCYLWHAMNEAKDTFTQTAGSPLEVGRRLTDKRLAAYVQRWTTLTTVALPLPGKNTTQDYVLSLAGGMQSVLRQSPHFPEAADPLLAAASRLLIFDKDASISSIRSHLHVDEKRAKALFDALDGKAYTSDEAGRPRRLEDKSD